MQCPECQFKNPAGAKFCNECGSKLDISCPSCSNLNPAGSKFCNECGHILSKRDVPREATDSLPPTPAEPTAPEFTSVPEGERRQATVVFSDLSGYTSMNEILDPEEVEAIMSRIKQEAVRIVERHGGIVNQFVGDEVLALFGIPTGHEDDPVRAVRAARELIQKGSTPEIKQISNLQSRVYCSLWHSSFAYLIGEDFGVMARVDEVLEVAEKTDSPIICYLCYAARGNAFMAVEQMEAARNSYERALQSIEGTEHRRYLEEVYHNLIETTMARGDLAAAEQFYQDLTPLLKLNPGKTAPRFDFLKGRLLTLADSPDYARADEFFQKSIHADETSGAVVLAARTQYYRADMLARKGETEPGRSLLHEIQQQFQGWGIPAWQLKCEQALQTISGD